MWRSIFAWVACVLVGAAAGFLIGWALYQVGFEVIGSTVAFIGAGVGGFVVLFAYLNWSEARAMSR
jgi:hypothetical protein